MSERAPVSVCMIVRDEAACLGACLDSIRPWVEEVVVVDTGSADDTPEVARCHGADVVEVFTDCNDPESGLIDDFALARNRAFGLGTRPWRLWLDGDDVVSEGAELLPKICAEYDQQRGEHAAIVAFPYEYDPHCHQFRERLVAPWDLFYWVHPVHETIALRDADRTKAGIDARLRVTHRRSESRKPVEPGRNVRILRRMHAEMGERDARVLFYLGRELSFRRESQEEAIPLLARYVEISGWDEERGLACIRLAEVHQTRGEHEDAIRWALRAVSLCERWGEGYFAAGRSHYAIAEQGGTRRDWERAAHFLELGLAQPPTRTLLFQNPEERLSAHRHLNMALNRLGRVSDALESVERGLADRPDDSNLLHNRAVYEVHLAERRVREARATIERYRPQLAASGLRVPEVLVAPERYAELARAIAEDRIATVTRVASAGAPSAPQHGASGTYQRPAAYPRGVTAGDFPVAIQGAHRQAWVVPSETVVDDLPLRMTDAQLEAMTVALWREYVLHDEILAAERLLADAPYRVKHSVAVGRALAATRAMTAWMDDAELEQETNAPADPTVECGVPLPGPLTGQLLGRYEIARTRLRPGDRVLDLGCSDGSIANRLALAGWDVVGVDLCRTSVDLARRKAEEFRTGAHFGCARFDAISPGFFDEERTVVITTDVYEHLRDHVSELIIPARLALGDNFSTGRLVLCTPHGAWMRGEYVPWAHPWRWADEKGAAWCAPERRAHLVAPTPWTVAAHLREGGFWVKDSFVELCAPARDVEGQGNVVAEGWLEAPWQRDGAPGDDGEGLDVVIACPPYSYEDWTPETARRGGIGGSETAIVEISRRLARMGHRVRVYATPGPHGDGIYDGVEYRHSSHIDLVDACDVLVAWRYCEMLEKVPGARVRLLWVHDVHAHGGTSARMLLADKVLCLSEWHADHAARHHEISRAQVHVTRNGIDVERFIRAWTLRRGARDPHRVVNSSSPDRSWKALLQIWPLVRARVPDATLHLFYGFDNWERFADEGQRAQIAELRGTIASLADQGVTLRGRVDQETLAREFVAAGAWAYPTWFSETSCISAMEARAAGLALVTSPIAALPETCGPAHYVEGDWLSPDYQERFADQLVRALDAYTDEARLETHAMAISRHDWGEVAREWEALFRSELARKQTDPLVPYAPARGFGR